MKKLNLIKRLLIDSHAKQTPQKFGRYAVMLLMLLTFGVGQMWGTDTYYLRGLSGSDWGTGSNNTMAEGSNNIVWMSHATDAGYIGFLITKGTSYDTKYGQTSDNVSFGAPYTMEQGGGNAYTDNWSSGTYYYYFNTSTLALTVYNTIEVKGDLMSDGWSSTTGMTFQSSDGSWKQNCSASLTAGNSYYFKIHANGTYTGYSSKVSCTNGTASAENGNDGDNIKVIPTHGGTAVVVFHPEADGTINVYCPYQVSYAAGTGATGTVDPSDAATHGSTCTLSSSTFSKTGYTQDGWATSNGGSKAYDLGATYTGGYTDVTLYPHWTANEYSITIDKNTGSANGAATATYDQKTLDITTNPTPNTGYHVVGYYLEPECTNQIADKDGNLIAGVGVLTNEDGKWISTSGTTIYPKWSNEYAITFNQNEPTIIGTSGTTATYNSAMPTITAPRKDGYIFGGYYYDAACTTYQYYYDDGRSAHTWDKVEDATLYAKWTGISYQVSFDGNGSTGGTMSDENFTYGADAKALTSNAFTRDGYYFLGWNTEPDGSGTNFYNEKEVSDLSKKQGAVITLYAQWAKEYTLYFIQAGCSWTYFYAKAEISFDDRTYYPLGEGNGTAMENDDRGIFMTNFTYESRHVFLLYKIEGVPEGSQIKFSNNGGDPRGNMSWSADKPYYLYGNNTWYALDRGAIPADIDTISTATNMCVDFESFITRYGIDQIGDDKYAIVELSGNTWYHFRYYNWLANGYSGCASTGDAANIITSGTTSGESPEWTLNNSNFVYLQTTVDGEYKFMLNGWDNGAPQVQIYYPVGVSLGLDKTQALSGASTTVTLTATKAKTYLTTSPTYYYQISTDNGSTWTTLAETSSTTYDYTFAARTCKFRVILENDKGLKSKSTTQDFKTYTTKSFYVYNPYDEGDWSTLYLYTWDSNNGDKKYNGDFPGYAHGSCINGNDIISKSKGSHWYYITINENANCFILSGGDAGHQTVTCYVSDYIQNAKYMIFTEDDANYVRDYHAKGATDFRLKYLYTVGLETKERYSDIYNTTLDGEAITTSMWLNANDATANLVIQQGNGEDSWTDIVFSAYSNSTKNGFGGLISSSATHGYVFTMKLNINTGTPAYSTISDAAEYTGPFYVRTDGLEGGWNVYKSKTNQMVKSESSLSGTPSYNYYICKWIGSEGTNVKYTIANDYNSALVENLEGDASATAPLYGRQTLPQAANVRFAWNSQTNTLTRSYLSGSTDLASRFLMLEETSSGKMYNSSGSAATELLFADNGNWVYQIVMYANPGAQAKVTAKYNNNVQEFISSMQLIGGTGPTKFKYRTVYDFKTNKLVTAFFPEDVIDKKYEINADMMILREGQGVANQITFLGTGELSNVKKVYGVMQFNKSTITANTPASQRGLYWISFPFDVSLGDVFGFGDYGRYWIIEEYNGAKRATDGYWADSEGFWEYVVDTTGVILYAGKGYVLALDLDLMTASSSVWDNSVSNVYLYFPSTGNVGNVTATDVEVTVASHSCSIDRTGNDGADINKNRTKADSHWNVIGVPSYANYGSTLLDESGDEIYWKDDPETDDVPFLYAWDPATNTYEVQDGNTYSFKSMYAYMVQYHGSIKWHLASAPAASVAARMTDVPDKEYMLSLIKDSVEEDHTFVRMSDKEGVTAGFEFGQDLCKEYNGNRGNIYTFVGYLPVAGNSLPHPLTTTVVPVGVKIAANGEYTFSMPEGTNGGDVWLIDNANSSRTNLGLMDYTVNLTTGTYEGRFSLEFPVQNVVTEIENAANANANASADDAVRKVFVGGQLYIIRDGVIYNASGARVQ